MEKLTFSVIRDPKSLLYIGLCEEYPSIKAYNKDISKALEGAVSLAKAFKEASDSKHFAQLSVWDEILEDGLDEE